MNSRYLFLVFVALTSGGMCVLFALHGANEAAGLILVFGLVWALPELFPRQRRLGWLRAGWISNLCFLFTAIGAAGLLLNRWSWWWALLVISVALAAWDLQAFRRRVFAPDTTLVDTILRSYQTGSENGASPTAPDGSSTEDEKLTGKTAQETSLPLNGSAARESAAFERSHLRALALVTLAGLFITAIVYELATRVRFSPVLGVGLLLSLGVVVVLSFLARLLVRS